MWKKINAAGNVVIYKLVPFVEARKNDKGFYQYTTGDLVNNTNQINAVPVMVQGKEYLVFNRTVK